MRAWRERRDDVLLIRRLQLHPRLDSNTSASFDLMAPRTAGATTITVRRCADDTRVGERELGGWWTGRRG